MRLLAPALALLAACSSETPTPPADAQVAPDLCVCQDGSVPPDVATEDRPDAWTWDERVRPPEDDVVTASDVVDAAVVDAAPLPDAVDAVDAAELPDAGPADAPDVVVAPDVADTGPADAGPQTFPLDPAPTALEVRVLYLRTCRSADGGPCDATPTDTVSGATCTRTGARLNFSLRACAGPRGSCVDLTGLFPDYRSSTGASIALVGGLANQARNLRIRAGGVASSRQSFHVQFDALAGAEAGATGIPGRTVDPSAGDLWLLGCPVQ